MNPRFYGWHTQASVTTPGQRLATQLIRSVCPDYDLNHRVKKSLELVQQFAIGSPWIYPNRCTANCQQQQPKLGARKLTRVRVLLENGLKDVEV